ncbi:hypothetical protein CASFOL_034824 [Castilleja foliolosa]|uniref:Phorbol-ester/DAG-type domain-containing protein n=1 Tax=Castilleja foliolosa TaxID=1961234 RepID=A0ABD3BRM8_9LAMI
MVDDIYLHTRRDRDVEAENKIDPDDGNSMVCNACRVPIFSTPFITTVDPDDHNNNDPDVIVHDRCANDHLPPRLEGRHPLHPGGDLVLHQHSTTMPSCSRCRSTCGSRFYKCRTNCGFQLDLLCALTIKILHRSHHHRLTATRGKSLFSFTCGACGSQHQPPPTAGAWLTVYVCSPCDYWIHPDCARLPNAIVLTNDNNKDEHHHPHPLLLTYSHFYYYGHCRICSRWYDGEYENSGVYVCFHCRYIAHIKCAVYADPHQISYKPVLIRDAHIPNLVHLPLPNEHTSVMNTILTNYVGGDHITTVTSTGSSTSTSIDDHQSDSSKLFENNKIHEHPLIFHEDHNHNPAVGVARVCNACVQFISPSDPFYTCANNNNNNELASSCCRDFFLHICCANLPTTLITQHLSHDNDNHPLSLLSKVNNMFNMFRCSGCQRQCNGFAYACVKCDDYYLDVVCAFMHTSITHDGHAKSHILHSPRLYPVRHMPCICCGDEIEKHKEIGYECNSCRKFSLHVRCALLPDTITHRFDRHPLKLLITTQRLIEADEHLQLVERGGDHQEKEEDEKIMFCEVCEVDMDDKYWHYGCKVCDQYFHVDCIPTLDRLSRIKFGFASTVHVTCHDCPLECVRAVSVDGYRCGHCQVIIRESDIMAFECSECYFRIHQDCARNLIKY